MEKILILIICLFLMACGRELEEGENTLIATDSLQSAKEYVGLTVEGEECRVRIENEKVSIGEMTASLVKDKNIVCDFAYEWAEEIALETFRPLENEVLKEVNLVYSDREKSKLLRVYIGDAYKEGRSLKNQCRKLRHRNYRQYTHCLSLKEI